MTDASDSALPAIPLAHVVRRRHRLFFILLGVIVVVMSWAIGEAMVRAYQAVLFNSLEAEVSDVLYFDRGWISGVQYQLKPDLALRYHTNAAGWRGPLLPETSGGALERRIAVVGDSIAFGLGIYDDRQTFSGQLEALLTDASKHGDLPRGISYHVYNFGVPGYSAWDIHAVAKHLVERYKIDWIIYVFCFNDFATPHVVDGHGLLVESEQDGDEEPLVKRWLKLSLLVRVTVNALRPVVNRVFPIERTDRYSSQPRWSPMKEEIHAMVEDVRREGVSFAAVIIPLGYHITYAPGVPVEEHREIALMFRSLGVPTVEVLEDYRTMNPKAVFPFGLLDGHPSPDAVAVAVRRLFTAVLQPRLTEQPMETPLRGAMRNAT